MYYCQCGGSESFNGDCGCERVSGERIKAICEELDRLEQYDIAAEKFREQLNDCWKKRLDAEEIEVMFNKTFKHVGKALKQKLHK